MLGDINRGLKPYEYRFYLCKPNKTTIGELYGIYNKSLIINYGGINELSFTIPYEIEKNNSFISTPYIDSVRGHYLVRMERKDEDNLLLDQEYFIITKPKNSFENNKKIKTVQCYSLGFELKDKLVRSYSGTKTLQEVLEETIETKTDWTIGTISDFANIYRNIEEGELNLLDFSNKLSQTFNGVIIWDTVNKELNMYNNENIGDDKGLTIEYGKYLKSLVQDPDFDNVVTRLYCFGKDEMTFNEVSSTGNNYIEDLSYYLYPFERDELGNVVAKSNYLSDDLCQALLDYDELLQSKEPEEDIAESGTNGTTIKLTAHGLTTGDYIKNISRREADINDNMVDVVRKINVLDINTLTVDNVDGQTFGDIIYKYNDSTFGKLLFTKRDIENKLTVLSNELVDLQDELVIINDTIDITQSNGDQYNNIETYSVGDRCLYEYAPYECILESTGNLPTNTNYWINIVNSRDDKQDEIDEKQSEIDAKELELDSIEDNIDTFRDELSIENNFTPSLIVERNLFIKEKTWRDDKYFIEEDLYEEGVKKLSTLSQPLISYTIDIIDLLKVIECQHDWKKLIIGDTITVKYSDFNVDIKAKIITIKYDIDDNKINLTIANTKDINSGFLTLENIISKAASTSTQVDMSKYKWEKAETASTEIERIVNNAWDATKQSIEGGMNNNVEISRRGIYIKDPLDPLRYLVAQNGVISLTADGGATWKHAITPEYIVGEHIVGILGEFCTVRANQIIVGDSGQQISDDLIANSGSWNGKNKTFTTTPTPPYDEGDLWRIAGATDLKVCVISRSTGNFISSDWVNATDVQTWVDTHAVRQNVEYNSVKITSNDGLKISHANGGYTQMKGDGIQRYVPLPEYTSSPTGVSNEQDFEDGIIPDDWETLICSIVTAPLPVHGGTYALRVGNGNHAEGYARTFQEITQDDTYFSFWYYFEGNDGTARAYINGEVVATFVRDSAWHQVSVLVDKGYHSFQFDIVDIDSDDYGRLYIDDIVFETSPVEYTLNQWIVPEEGYKYNFRTYIEDASTAGIYGSNDGTTENYITPIWIDLPEDFKGQDFKIFLSVKNSDLVVSYSIAKIVLEVLEIDQENGRFKVLAYCVGNYYWYDGYVYSRYNTQYWGFTFTYFAVY